jgi:transcriptional regulator with XRE-family HTH domain
MNQESKSYFVGPAIRRERLAKGIKNQVDFAPIIGVSQSFLSLVESNRQAVSMEFIERCAQELGITPDELLNGQTSNIFIIEQQQSGNNGNFNTLHTSGDLVEVLKELLQTLKEQNADLRARFLRLETDHVNLQVKFSDLANEIQILKAVSA